MMGSKISTEQRNNFGQLSRNMTTDQEKCYDPLDTSLTFVNGEDDLDFLCMDYKSLRAKMSCGHAVTPMSLTDWCRRLLDKGESKFVCGQPGCDLEWPFDEVRKMALLTPEENKYFEDKMFSNAADDLDIKVCPGCKSPVSRADPHNLCVLCTVCKAARRRYYRFCWQCLRKWKGPAPRSDRCENDGCVNEQLEILRTCPDIVFEEVEGVTGCPSVRACTTCGLLLEHNRTQCKNIVCPRCKVEFCFVCLKLTNECLEATEESMEDPEEGLEVIEEALEVTEDLEGESDSKDRLELSEILMKFSEQLKELTEESNDTKEREELQQSKTEEGGAEEIRDVGEPLMALPSRFMQSSESDYEDSEEEESEEEEDLCPHYILCSSGVAPRQTSIPVWKRT